MILQDVELETDLLFKMTPRAIVSLLITIHMATAECTFGTESMKETEIKYMRGDVQTDGSVYAQCLNGETECYYIISQEHNVHRRISCEGISRTDGASHPDINTFPLKLEDNMHP